MVTCDTLDKSLYWRFYLDKRSKWRWSARSINRRIVGASTQGYVTHRDCLANAELFGYKDD